MERTIVLEFRNGKRKGRSQEFPVVGQARIRMGREPECEVCFEATRDERVSRLHCQVDVGLPEGPPFLLTDLNSRNGTFVNRRRISEAVELRSGDIVKLGRTGPEMEFKVDC